MKVGSEGGKVVLGLGWVRGAQGVGTRVRACVAGLDAGNGNACVIQQLASRAVVSPRSSEHCRCNCSSRKEAAAAAVANLLPQW